MSGSITRGGSLLSSITNVILMVRYNLKIIFANKFIYFLLASLGLYLLVVSINFFQENDMMILDVYNFLLFPGSILLFYPTVYGIQNDEDARSLEIIFGIPNYRYKVYLLRLAIIYVILFFALWVLVRLTDFVLLDLPIAQMTYQLMYPLFFLGCLAFFLSTILRNGNATAVVMIILGVVLMIFSENMENSMWTFFLNPFREPRGINDLAWQETIFRNRIFLFSGGALTLVGALGNLQKREKFMG